MPAARHFSELVVWRLADELRVETFKLTRRLPFDRDFKHQRQAEDAIDSVCRNIAEGFGCRHLEFARFLEISRRSLNELVDTFRSAQLKGYVTASELVPVNGLTRRLYPALGRFIKYLRSTPDRRDRNDTPQRYSTRNRQRTRTDDRKTDRTDDH